MSDVAGLYRRFGVRLPPLGDGWASTRCFAGGHHDRHPSARIHLRSGGFRCFACGARGGVLDALELLGVRDRDEARRFAVDYGILDPPKRLKRARGTTEPPAAKRVEQTERVDYDRLVVGSNVVHDRTWTYVDQNGVPAGRVRRLDLADGQKRIWQERPEHDGWAAGLDGAQLPLYQLPLVLAAARQGAPIVVVEGEKAVDALERIGLLATTNAGGAGKWRPEHTLALRGAVVQVSCDCDRPGRQHAHDVTLELVRAGVHARNPYDPAPLRHDGYDIVDQLTELAQTIQATTPEIETSSLRERLGQRLRQELGRALDASIDGLQHWYEHVSYLADPNGHAYLACGSCGRERLHTLSHGIAYCRCGRHQLAPA